MLSLTRKEGEEIVIDGRIVVRVDEISGNRVRLMVQAPREVPVNRREVQNKLDAKVPA